MPTLRSAPSAVLLLGALSLLAGCSSNSKGVSCDISPPPPSGTCANTPGPTGEAPADSLLDSGVTLHANLTFQADAGIALQGDLYVPQGVETADAGVVVVIHGGGFNDCDRRRDAVAPYAEATAQSTGAGVFNIDYRLTQEGGGYPNNLLDTVCALEWLGQHAGDYHLNGARIAVVGDSMGGVLALDAALESHRADLDPRCGPLPVITTVVTYSSPTDLPVLASTNSSLVDAVKAYAGPCDTGLPVCDVGKSCTRCIDASPAAHACVSGDPTRFVLVQAPDAYDPIVPQAQATEMADAFSLIGAQGQLVIPPVTQLQDQGCQANDAAHPAHGLLTPCLAGATSVLVTGELKAAVGP